MMDTILSAPEPAEKALGLVHVGAVRCDKLVRMIDAPHIIRGMQDIPAASFVGMDDRAGCDMLADQRDSGSLL